MMALPVRLLPRPQLGVWGRARLSPRQRRLASRERPAAGRPGTAGRDWCPDDGDGQRCGQTARLGRGRATATGGRKRVEGRPRRPPPPRFSIPFSFATHEALGPTGLAPGTAQLREMPAPGRGRGGRMADGEPRGLTSPLSRAAQGPRVRACSASAPRTPPCRESRRPLSCGAGAPGEKLILASGSAETAAPAGAPPPPGQMPSGETAWLPQVPSLKSSGEPPPAGTTDPPRHPEGVPVAATLGSGSPWEPC